MSKDKSKAKGDKPEEKESKRQTKAGPKSNPDKNSVGARANTKAQKPISEKEGRVIWAQVKAEKAKANVEKTLDEMPMVQIVLWALDIIFGIENAVEKIGYGNPQEGSKIRNYEEKRRVFNAIRKALVEEGYFSWEKDDMNYVAFQRQFNTLWTELNELWYNANKANS
jgi:hypothetical protein